MSELLSREVPRGRIDCHPDAPLEWEKCPFGKIAEVNRLYPMERGREYPFLEMAAIKEGFGGIIDYAFRPFEGSLSRFALNDTIFAKITPCAENGKVAFVDRLPAEYGAGSTEFIVLSPREGLDPFFVHSLAISPAIHSRAVSRMEGSTGRLRVTEETFKKWMWVSIPPTRNEQTRIAETLKAADDHIRAIEEQIRKAERAKRGLIENGTTLGLSATAKTKTIFRYRYSFPCNANWEHVELRGLRPQIDYGTNQSSNDYRAGVPVIAIPQVLTSRFAMSELPFADVGEQEKASLALQPHDVLLVRTNGNPSYIGRSTVIPEGVLESLTIYASYLIRVRVDEKRLRGAFLNYVLQSQTGRRQSNCLANTSAGNFNLGARSLSKFLIPLPKPEEQDEIIQAINAADDLVLGLQEQLTAARRVKQSLLQNLLTGKIRLKL